jgi:hypothetical protein
MYIYICGSSGKFTAKTFVSKLEFVKEWVVKSQKMLFTFSDISHKCYLGMYFVKKTGILYKTFD